MKIWQTIGVLSVALNALSVNAGEIKTDPMVSELPTEEKAFVDAVGKLNKSKIVELLGEPAKSEDVKLKDSGRVVASIWHYHYINTSANGEYYQTTELDFIDDKVNVVVFLNNDGSDQSPTGQTYETPEIKPEM